jgi:superfamily II DNA or RNA helicase
MEPLSQLKDIHLPPPVPNFPWAIGWWLLLFIVVALLLGALFVWRKRQKKNYHKKQTLNYLKQTKLTKAELHQLMKALCLRYFSRAMVASLYGGAFTEFLTQQLPPKLRTDFANQWQQFEQTCYQQGEQMASNDELTLCQTWIRHALPPKQNMVGG